MEKQKYRFEKLVFRLTIGFMVAFFVVLLFTFGLNNNYYISCPKDSNTNCVNMIYQCSNNNDFNKDCIGYDKVLGWCNENPLNPICTTPTIQPGEFLGNPPPFLLKNAGLILFAIICAGFAVNHVAYNMGKQNEN